MTLFHDTYADWHREATRDEMRAMFDDTPNPPKRQPRTLPKDWMPFEGPYDLTGMDEIIRKARINRARLARKRGLK